MQARQSNFKTERWSLEPNRITTKVHRDTALATTTNKSWCLIKESQFKEVLLIQAFESCKQQQTQQLSQPEIKAILPPNAAHQEEDRRLSRDPVQRLNRNRRALSNRLLLTPIRLSEEYLREKVYPKVSLYQLSKRLRLDLPPLSRAKSFLSVVKKNAKLPTLVAVNKSAENPGAENAKMLKVPPLSIKAVSLIKAFESMTKSQQRIVRHLALTIRTTWVVRKAMVERQIAPKC